MDVADEATGLLQKGTTEKTDRAASARLRVTTIAEPRKKIFHMWDTLHLSWTKKTVPECVAVRCEDRTKALWTPTLPDLPGA